MRTLIASVLFLCLGVSGLAAEGALPPDREERLHRAEALSESTAPLAVPTVRFRWPLSIHDWNHVSFYRDLDPSMGILDWDCQDAVYDGHTGDDIIIRDFVEMDHGRYVLAAADGIVGYVADGFYDEGEGPQVRSNYVRLLHADGTESWYYHNRQWSTLVDVGQPIRRGQPLALIGASGFGVHPHVHFEVSNAGTIYESFAGTCNAGDSLWESQPAHASANPVALYDFGVANLVEPSIARMRYGMAKVTRVTQVQSPAARIFVWFKLSDVHDGDTLTVTYRKPDGTVHNAFPVTYGQYYPDFYNWYFQDLPESGAIGTWTVELDLNGTIQGSTTFRFDAVAQQSPVAESRTVAVTRGAIREELRGSAADAELQDFQQVSGPASGKLSLSGPRNSRFAYVPDDGFSGNDTFQFRVQDGQGAFSAPATVTLAVSSHQANALRVEGLDDYVVVPSHPSLDLTAPFSVEAWIRRDQGSSEWEVILDRRHPVDLERDRHGFALTRTWDNLLLFNIGNGTFGVYSYSTDRIPPGVWTHVAGVWDGTWVRTYVNGVEQPNPAFFDGTPSYVGVGDLRIGNSFHSSGQEGFRGEIQELRIWDVARTEAQIEEGMGCGFFDAPQPTSLRGRWPFRGDAMDASTWGNHGVPVSVSTFARVPSAVPLDCVGSDADADGLSDISDNCPLDGPSGQIDGDGDGVGDQCDLCVSVADRFQVDSDRDGVGDACDNCPLLGNTEQSDGDGDGSGDLCDPDAGDAEEGVPSSVGGLGMAHAGGVTTLSWAAEPLSSSYQVFRVTREQLFYRFYGICQNFRDSDLTDTSFEEPETPALGEFWGYLVLGVSPGGARGRAGSDSNLAERDLRGPDCP